MLVGTALAGTEDVFRPLAFVCALIGSKEGIANFPVAVVDPGDIVLMPDPGYPEIGRAHV